MTKKFITVVIPAKNESKVIKYTVTRAIEAFERCGINGDCLVINNSTF